VQVGLTPELEAYVRRKVASGRYADASAVVRDAVRLLIEREADVSPPRPKALVQATIAAMEEALRKKGVVSAALFGSIARDEAGPESDVDVLIDVDPASRFSLVDLVEVKTMLEEMLGREVDVVTREGLDPRLRERVMREAENVFS